MPRRRSLKRTDLKNTLKNNGASIIAGLVFVALIIGLVSIRGLQSTSAVGANSSAPQKPTGTQTGGTQVSGNWNVAQGLPPGVTRMTFSAQKPTQGFATALVTKQTQEIYATTDAGANWQKISTVQAPVGDILSSNPTDPRDIVLLSVYVPTVGSYSFQRSYDGGQTWTTQTTTMNSTATVTQTGWVDSTFIVGFELDGQQTGHSALVAFPEKQSGRHLDVNGLINGIAIPHLKLIAGHHERLQVWGTDDSSTPKSIELVTSDLGAHWTTAYDDTPGKTPMPVAATDDGSTIVYESADGTQFSKSDDGGDTQTTQPPLSTNGQINQSVFLTPDGKQFAAARNDGTYLIRNGQWSKVTSVPIAYLTDGAAGHARLWSVNNQGQLTWQDD